MNYRAYMDEETARKVKAIFQEVYLTGNAAKGFDWEVVRKDGARRILEISVSPMTDPHGRTLGFYGTGRDITERREAEEQATLHQQQLMQASKMVALGTLVSSVAHEINNPNNFIMLNTPLLWEAWREAQPILREYEEQHGDFVLAGMSYRELAEKIPVLFSGVLNGAKRIKQIVEDLRDFIRRDSSDMSQSVDVNAVIRSAISLLSNMIMKSTHRFRVEYGTGLPCVKGNFQRFEQVVINLLQNACQALPDPGRAILLSTSYDPGSAHVVVNVEDEGRGIAADVLPHIMDPFFTTKGQTGGLGLGLSISSRIVKEHGGSLTFTSEAGGGTRAEILLPAIQERSISGDRT